MKIIPNQMIHTIDQRKRAQQALIEARKSIKFPCVSKLPLEIIEIDFKAILQKCNNGYMELYIWYIYALLR